MQINDPPAVHGNLSDMETPVSDDHGSLFSARGEIAFRGVERAQETGRWRGLIRRRLVWLLPLIVTVTAAWASRDAMLSGAGRLLVSEDPLEPVDVIVVSAASAAADAIEAGRLYRDGYGTEILVPAWVPEPLVPTIRDLGIPYFASTELVTIILEHSGVPAAAVQVLPDVVDGTESEIAAVAAVSKLRRPASLLFITARDHTSRARWLLRRELSPATKVIVRAPRTDPFHAESWWQSRELTRGVLTEYLRWVNTLILRDPWRSATVTGVASSPKAGDPG